MTRLTIEHDLYSDCRVVHQGQATATRLSALLEGHFSHDRLTRSLTQADYGSAQLWQLVKPFVHPMAQPGGVLIFYKSMNGAARAVQHGLCGFRLPTGCAPRATMFTFLVCKHGHTQTSKT